MTKFKINDIVAKRSGEPLENNSLTGKIIGYTKIMQECKLIDAIVISNCTHSIPTNELMPMIPTLEMV